MRTVPAAIQVRSALKEGIARLAAASVPSSALAAELLLIHTLGRDRTWLYTHPEERLDGASAEKYFALIARRAAGEPTQYILGKQEFWGLEFEVTPAVLIPRPETEHLIEVAIERIGASRRNSKLRIADVGTGSGCIAVALAKEFPNAEIAATDISAAALEIAKRNAARHHVAARMQLAQADLLEATFHRSPNAESQGPPESQVTSHESRPFDLIVSNPPYIAESEATALQREVREYEPQVALFAGPSGLQFYARLIEQAESRLVARGSLILELGFGSAERVCEMIEARGVWTSVAVTNDLAGIPRVLAAQLAELGGEASLIGQKITV